MKNEIGNVVGVVFYPFAYPPSSISIFSRGSIIYYRITVLRVNVNGG